MQKKVHIDINLYNRLIQEENKLQTKVIEKNLESFMNFQK